MPFWSSETRARSVVETVAAYSGFEIVSIPLNTFAERWVPGLETDGLLAGLNWSGPRATGLDLAPSEVQRKLEAAINEHGA